jgi:hypothetical protein
MRGRSRRGSWSTSELPRREPAQFPPSVWGFCGSNGKRAEGATRCGVGAGGGGRTLTRCDPNGILSRAVGAGREAPKRHKRSRQATLCGSASDRSYPQKHQVAGRSSTERAQFESRVSARRLDETVRSGRASIAVPWCPRAVPVRAPGALVHQAPAEYDRCQRGLHPAPRAPYANMREE